MKNLDELSENIEKAIKEYADGIYNNKQAFLEEQNKIAEKENEGLIKKLEETVNHNQELSNKLRDAVKIKREFLNINGASSTRIKLDEYRIILALANGATKKKVSQSSHYSQKEIEYILSNLNKKNLLLL